MVQPQQPNHLTSSISSSASEGENHSDTSLQSQGGLQTLTPERVQNSQPFVEVQETVHGIQRYQIRQKLGQSATRNSTTYLAQDTITQQAVVIKQLEGEDTEVTFLDWQGFKAQIQHLQTLNHPRLLTYQYSFKTRQGFCLIRNYLAHCQPLSEKQNLSFLELKTITLNLLDLLSELHQQNPAVIHYNIKPENILLDEHLTPYLVDLSWTPQFPESLLASQPDSSESRPAPRASATWDLYGVGMTLISVLTQTPWTELTSELVPFSLFRQKLSSLNPEFLDWLECLVNCNQPGHYQSASQGKAVLERLSLAPVPEVSLKLPPLTFKARQIGDLLTQPLRLKRGLPLSLTEGQWEIAPHPDDLSHNGEFHPWIRITPAQVQSPKTEYQITIDTSSLTLGQTYERQLILHKYSTPEFKYVLTLQIDLVALKPSLQDWLIQRLPKSLPLKKQYPNVQRLAPDEITLALTRYGTPSWTEEDFQKLLKTLGEAGYGWLNPEGIRQQLEQMSQRHQY